jgi:phage FluMu protein Com/predicted Ser/Thr protein kinase
MPQVTRCPHCNKSLQVPDDVAGKAIRCPLCKQLFAVRVAPAPEPVAVAAAVSAKPPTVTARPPLTGGTSTGRTSGSRPAPANGPSPAPPTECPACKSKLLPGATACLDCGYLVQGEGAGIESEAAPNLCPNAACGVANPANARVCQRCSSPLPMPTGTLLHGRYRIEGLIAIGGFAAVYLATDLRNGNRSVAIKDMIGSETQEFPIRLSFFKREAEILRALASLPAVPRFYEFIHQGQSAQLVLEYIRGQDLLKIMEANANKPFDLEQVIEWGKSICDVLTHMHTLTPPLVHRDVKPDNIMLSEDQRSIKMIDFGTARDMGRSQKTRLAAKTRVYTEGYAPPEQIIGKPEARSDLFALAGTLYHLATGKAPEGFYTARELEAQLADPSSPIPAERRWLFELIKINLAEDVNDRYFSCKEVKADLERRCLTKEAPCPKCQAANPVRQPYCCKCAEPLTEPMAPCHDCGKSNRMGSRWCIHCGHRLR